MTRGATHSHNKDRRPSDSGYSNNSWGKSSGDKNTEVFKETTKVDVEKRVHYIQRMQIVPEVL
eukprot:3635059-Pyramimonas_sp.AAC.1